MHHHFERLVIGLPVAALAPVLVPWLATRVLARALLASAIAAWIVVPISDAPDRLRVLALIPVAAQLLPLVLAGTAGNVAIAVCAGALGLAEALLANSDGVGRHISSLLHNDRAVIIASGWVIASFGLGWVIGKLTAPLAAAVARAVPDVQETGLTGAGRYLGWLERTLIFGALLLGRIEVIALVVTIKSIARFPSLKQEVFADYFLVGNLLSLIGVIVISVATRLVLGLAPL